MTWDNKATKFWKQFVFVFLINTHCETPNNFIAAMATMGFLNLVSHSNTLQLSISIEITIMAQWDMLEWS